ncbi:hypothetical protein [Rhodococcus sp. SJ-3]|uniref:hypothetical protein n=1 Tax=Rhodococcus sp. SJ-3 TaxID=3454628 RepID=UPI003F78E5DA
MKAPHEDKTESDPKQDTFSAAAAARLAGVGRASIQRALNANRFPQAVKGQEGWQITLQDLIAAGFPPRPDQAVEAQPGHLPNDVKTLQTQLLAAWDKLEAESAARQNAEQLAKERAQHVADLRGVLDVLRSQIAGTGAEPMRNRP